MEKSKGKPLSRRQEIFRLILDAIRSEPKSINAIARETNLEWKTVKNAIELLIDLESIKKSSTKIKGKKIHLFKLKS